MLDLMPSECTPRFALNKHDAVLVRGVRYRPLDATDKGYILVRADGQGVAESYSRTEMARLVELGHVTHQRNAFLPESARRQLELPSEMLSAMGDEKHRKAKRREAVVLAFLALEEEGRVKRTDASIESDLNDIKVKRGNRHTIWIAVRGGS